MTWVRIFLLLLVAMTPLSSAFGEDGTDAGSFIRSFIARSVHIRTDALLSPQQKSHESKALLEECYDIVNVPRAIIGRYWDKATAEQQARYRAIFEDYLLVSYGPKFDAIAGRLTVTAADIDGNQAIVHSLDGAKPGNLMVVDWMLDRTADRHWRIADVLINGASSVEVMRQDFISVLRANNGDIDALVAALARQIEILRKTPA